MPSKAEPIKVLGRKDRVMVLQMGITKMASMMRRQTLTMTWKSLSEAVSLIAPFILPSPLIEPTACLPLDELVGYDNEN